MTLDLETTYRRFGPMVLRRCRRLLRDEDLARDAMHDVFVQLLRHQDRLAGDSPSGLLYRIATNVCLNRLRTRRRRPETPDDELLHAIATSEDLETSTAARRLLAAVLGPAPESTRVIAVLHYCDGMTLEEVAAEVGMSVSGIRKRLRALAAQVPPLADREVA